MSKPRMFISSNYAELTEVRTHVAKFVKDYGYIPVTFEKNDVPFLLNSSIEESCYEEISKCSLFILIIKEKFGSMAKSIKYSDSKYHSVTQTEYEVARSLGIPIFVFIHSSSYDEYQAYVKQKKAKKFSFHYLENIHLAKFIDDIFLDKTYLYIHRYTSADDIETTLKKQWAGLFQTYLHNAQKYTLKRNELVPVNPFKLFYFRRHKGLSQNDLAKRTDISQGKIQKLEDAGIKKNHIEGTDFETIKLEELQKIANVLQCSVGNIRGGLPDDLFSQYQLYYYKNKGVQSKNRKGDNPSNLFKIKAVIFDFDGTLTMPDKITTWEKIWSELGFENNECANLHKRYSTSEITHKQWCEETERIFKQKKLSKTHLDRIAEEQIFLVDGVEETLKELAANGVSSYICSGSIDYIIKKSLKENYSLFEEVKSNKFIFDNDNILKSIIGTKYDFEGKAHYISQVAKENDLNSFEILFVGNSLNDEWAHQSGAMTLCVNPDMTNPDHPFQWMYSIRQMKNLKDILKIINY